MQHKKWNIVLTPLLATTFAKNITLNEARFDVNLVKLNLLTA